MSSEYDVIVVGAGIEGSATAYHAALSNKTLLLEQFPLPHSRGSSHGPSRIIRRAYVQDHYALMMPSAFSMWKKLEDEEGVQIIRKTGLLTLGFEHDGETEQTARAMIKANAPFERLNANQISQRFKMLKNVDPECFALFDPDGGIIRSDMALQSLWNQFRKRGGTLRDGEQVLGVTPGDTVTVTTTMGSYTGKSVVLCLGPWTSKIVKPLGLHLPLQPIRICVSYWRTLSDQYDADKAMPCLFAPGPEKEHVFGLPCLEYPGQFKLCFHSGPAIDPDSRDAPDALRENSRIVENMKRFVQENFNGLESQPSILDSCIYTMTPDHDLVLDSHPHWKNIVIGAGFSGHGFKLAPVVGQILTELATGKQPSFSLAPMSIDRFFKSGKL